MLKDSQDCKKGEREEPILKKKQGRGKGEREMRSIEGNK